MAKKKRSILSLLFGCNHSYVRVKKIKRKGIEQQRCRKCGQLRNQSIKCGRFSHRWKMDRRYKTPTFVCKNCGEIRHAA